MPFTVAIVGRPNVGKSTLFNRLAGRRTALVDKTPGLTRDRREGMWDPGGGLAPVRLIDTAGLEEGEEATITGRMRAQTLAAVAESDLVLFVIDARAGLLPADEVFGEMVRAADRPLLLVANKCEGRTGLDGAMEGYALGLGDPLAISAEHGLGIGDLLCEITDEMARQGAETDSGEAVDNDRPLRIAVVGRPNAGKSTLVNALLGENRMITGPEAGITRDSISVEMAWRGERVRLFDTAGLRRKSRINETAERLSVGDALRAVRFAEVVVLLLDAEAPFEKQDLTIAKLIADEGRALVIAINKWDLVADKKARLTVLRREADRLLAQVRGVALVAISALEEHGLDRLMKAVFSANEDWNRRISTGALNRYLADAVEQHTPPAVAGRRIRLRYMTQPNARPPTFIVFCSRPDDLPESYSRYLVNGLRETFDLPGVPIRLHLRKGKNPYVRS